MAVQSSARMVFDQSRGPVLVLDRRLAVAGVPPNCGSKPDLGITIIWLSRPAERRQVGGPGAAIFMFSRVVPAQFWG